MGVPLLRKIFDDGRLIYEIPSIEEIQHYCLEQIKLLPAQFTHLDYRPSEFPVLYSEKLKNITQEFNPN